jgi:hypothetical protein
LFCSGAELGALLRSVVHHRVLGDRYQLVADLVIDGLVNIEPLDGEADLP